jgi:hypothetical protein
MPSAFARATSSPTRPRSTGSSADPLASFFERVLCFMVFLPGILASLSRRFSAGS